MDESTQMENCVKGSGQAKGIILATLPFFAPDEKKRGTEGLGVVTRELQIEKDTVVGSRRKWSQQGGRNVSCVDAGCRLRVIDREEKEKLNDLTQTPYTLFSSASLFFPSTIVSS